MIIDFHAHIGMGIAGSKDPLQTNITPEMVVRPAEEAGIDRTCVFPVTYRPEEYERACCEVADAVRRYSERLVGFARLAPSGQAPHILERVVSRLGLRGLKLHHGLDRFDLLDSGVHNLLHKAGELGIPVIFHSIGVLDKLEALARDHPQTAIVFGHAGGLWNFRDVLRCGELAAELDNVYFETSSVLVTEALRRAILAAPDKALFGSDAPAIHPHVELEKIRVLRLPEEIEAKVLGGNAAALLGLAPG